MAEKYIMVKYVFCIYIFWEETSEKDFPIASCLDFPTILSKTKNRRNNYYHERTTGTKH